MLHMLLQHVFTVLSHAIHIQTILHVCPIVFIIQCFVVTRSSILTRSLSVHLQDSSHLWTIETGRRTSMQLMDNRHRVKFSRGQSYSSMMRSEFDDRTVSKPSTKQNVVPEASWHPAKKTPYSIWSTACPISINLHCWQVHHCSRQWP